MSEPAEPRALVKAAALALDYAAMADESVKGKHLDAAGLFLRSALERVDDLRMGPVRPPFPPEAMEAG